MRSGKLAITATLVVSIVVYCLKPGWATGLIMILAGLSAAVSDPPLPKDFAKKLIDKLP